MASEQLAVALEAELKGGSIFEGSSEVGRGGPQFLDNLHRKGRHPQGKVPPATQDDMLNLLHKSPWVLAKNPHYLESLCGRGIQASQEGFRLPRSHYKTLLIAAGVALFLCSAIG